MGYGVKYDKHAARRSGRDDDRKTPPAQSLGGPLPAPSTHAGIEINARAGLQVWRQLRRRDYFIVTKHDG